MDDDRQASKNVLKKEIGVPLIVILFNMERYCEQREIVSKQRAFSWWKLMSDHIKSMETVQALQNEQESKASFLGSLPKVGRRTSLLQEHLSDPRDIDRHTTIDSVSSTLRSTYVHLTAESEIYHTKLSELHDHAKTEQQFKDAAKRAKLMMVTVFLRQSLKRKLRWGFDKWHFKHIRMAKSEAKVKKLFTSLNLESQKTATRQFHIEDKLVQNETVSNAIECSHAFSHWKMRVVKAILQEERERGEMERRKLLVAFRELKTLLHHKNLREKVALSRAVSNGKQLSGGLQQLYQSLREADSLNRDITKAIGKGAVAESDTAVN